MPDTKTRPAPPPLEYRCPDCPLCYVETSHEDDSFYCEACGAWWNSNGNDDGEWSDPDVEQCDATVQPLADNPLVSDEARAEVIRCVLTADHTSKHASTSYAYCAKGWA